MGIEYTPTPSDSIDRWTRGSAVDAASDEPAWRRDLSRLSGLAHTVEAARLGVLSADGTARACDAVRVLAARADDLLGLSVEQRERPSCEHVRAVTATIRAYVRSLPPDAIDRLPRSGWTLAWHDGRPRSADVAGIWEQLRVTEHGRPAPDATVWALASALFGVAL